MTVKLDLPPEVEASLVAQDRAAGLSLDQYLRRKIEGMVEATGTDAAADARTVTGEDWERGLEEWLDSFPQGEALPEEALRRADWYPDRW